MQILNYLRKAILILSLLLGTYYNSISQCNDVVVVDFTATGSCDGCTALPECVQTSVTVDNSDTACCVGPNNANSSNCKQLNINTDGLVATCFNIVGTPQDNGANWWIVDGSSGDCGTLVQLGGGSEVILDVFDDGGIVEIVICKQGSGTMVLDLCAIPCCEINGIDIPNQSYLCFEDVPAPTTMADFEAMGGIIDIIDLVGSNGCDAIEFTYTDDAIPSEICTDKVFQRTYDICFCGDQDFTVTHTITISADNEAPTLEVDGSTTDFATIDLGCVTDVPTLPSELPITSVADDCSVVDATDAIIIDDSPGIDQGNCQFLITRTYSITDACDSEAAVTESWTYTLNANPPTFDLTPFDIAFSCVDDVPPAPDLDWSDDCDGTGSVSVVETIGTIDPCTGGNITREWSYTDQCGLSVTHLQTILINPQTSLSFSNLPTDITISCNDPVPDPVDLTYSNGSTNPSCEENGSVSPTDVGTLNTCGDELQRTWDFTSACGVNITHTQVITLLDNMPPVLQSTPGDITISCASDTPPIPDIIWDDDCDGTGTANVTETPNLNGCNGGTIERLISFTDNCGNTVEHTQNIIVSPYPDVEWISSLPTDFTLMCGDAVPSSPDLEYSNGLDGTACLVSGTVSATDSGTLNQCGDALVRTWTLPANSNDCIIELTHSITITLQDDGLPNFINLPPTSVNVACTSEIPASQELDWEDDCDGVGTVGFTDDGSPDPCNGGNITRTWTFTDNCGNGPITFSQLYIIQGTEFTSCDDNDSCTDNDMEKLDCEGNVCIPCQGTPTDCNGEVNFESCDDNNPCTDNDEQGVACDGTICVPCQGVAAVTCSGAIPNEILPCDDGDPCTTNDVYEVDGCDLATECVPCQGTYNPTPDPTPATNSIGCLDETTTLMLSGCGGTVTWYDAPGGNLLHIGETFTTPVLTSDEVYYVSCTINGCESNAIAMPVSVITATQVNITGPNELCIDQETITINADSGYDTYDWGTGAGTNATFDVSEAGTYSVTATDSNGCTSETTFTVNAAEIPNISIAGSTTFCIGGSTSLNVPTGFTNYSWGPNGETSNSIDVSDVGTYTVTVTNTSGCTGEATIDVIEANGLMPVISGDLSFCQGESTEISVGTGYASIDWAPTGESSETITVSTAQTYSVTVSDADGCTGIATVDITEDPLPTPSIIGDNLICENGNSTITVDGTFNSYLWGDGSINQDLDITAPGSYTVTVTDANGCEGTTTFVVDSAPDPIVEITGDLMICPGNIDASTLIATSGYSEYVWSNGASTSNTLDVNQTGTYTVTVTDANGCEGETSVNVTLNTPPVVNINGNLQFCSGFTTNLAADSGFTNYEWSNGANTESIDAGTSGTYSVTVTDTEGCTNEATVSVSELTELMPEIIGDLDICPGGMEEISLTVAGSFETYDWGSGPGTETSLTVNSAGDYSVTVTDINGCSGNATITITENTVEQVTINGGPTFCAGSTLELKAVGNFDSYTWSNGINSDGITINSAGTYTVTATDSNGCTNTSEIEIIEIPDPTVSIDGDLLICPGGNDMATISATSGYQNYEWSNGTNGTNEITIGAPGPYTVTVTDENGCTNSATVSITEATPPEVVIDGNLIFCTGFSSIISTPIGMDSYEWSDGSTSNEIEVTTSGTYVVTVTDTNGCTGTNSAEVMELSELMPTIIGDLDICPGQTEEVVLSVDGTFVSYEWAGDATSSDPTLTINQAGTYAITVTDSNGCSGNSSITVTENTVDEVTINGGPSFCTGATVDLTASGNFDSYAWSNGTTSDVVTISLVGTYTVTATDSNGCTNTSEIEITEIPDPPVSIDGDLLICPDGNDTATITATEGYQNYVWSNGKEGTNEILAEESGSYTVTVTDENGCTNTATFTVTQATPPEVMIDGSPIFCTGFSSTISTPIGMDSYEWSDGSTTNEIEVSTSGTYVVTVTDANGCTGTNSIEVMELSELMPNIIGDLDICPGQTEEVVLSIDQTFVSYEWGGDATGSDPTLTINQAGTYAITVTDSNGCSGNSSITVTENAVDEVTISGGPSFCSGTTLNLIADGNFDSYSWSNGNNLASIGVSDPGTYTVTATDSNGCTNTAEIEVTEIPDPPVSIDGDFTLCPDGIDMVTLIATSGYQNYEWSDGSTGSNEITIGAPGPYTVTVTDENGCTNTATAEVIEDTPPDVSIDGNLVFCTGFSSTLTATTGFDSYEWSSGDTTNPIDVSASGTYVVTVTDTNGCTNTSSIEITELSELMPTIEGDLDVCPGQYEDVILQVNGDYETFEWGDNLGSGSSITINEAGIYSITVTDINGCSGNSSVTITENVVDDVSIMGPDSFCAGSNAGLSATAGWTSYEWSNGTTVFFNDVNEPGIYTVTVTDENGCTNTAEFNLTQTEIPIVEITGDFDLCEGDSETIDVGTWADVIWSTGEMGSTIDVNSAGDYSATVTDENGCTNIAEVTIVVNPLPSPEISGDLSFCLAGSTTITLDGSYNDVIWSTGETSNSIDVNTFEEFTVTVTDANGCNNTASVTTELQDGLFPEITGPDLVCIGSSIELDAGEYLSYIWDDGSTINPLEVTGAGSYSVTVTDAGDCTGVATYTVTEAIPEPVEITGNPWFCEGMSVNITAEGDHVAYEWSTGEPTATIEVNEIGIYSVTATDANGCMATNEIEIIQQPNPEPTIEGVFQFCIDEETTISVLEEYISYEWSTGETTQEISVGEIATYSVTVTDENGCTGTQEVEVTEYPPLNPRISGLLIFCIDGFTELFADPGYTIYNWNNGETTETITVGTEGIYTVTVTDEFGCTAETSVEVIEQDQLYPELTSTGMFCEGGQGIISAGADYTEYIWDDPNNSTTPTIVVQQEGIYSVTVTDAYGCTGTGVHEILEVPTPEIEITGDIELCEGESTELFATPGYVAYLWAPSGEDESLEVDKEGAYSVTVFDENGCSATTSVYVEIFENPEPELYGDDIVCFGYTNTFEVVQNFETYEWSTGETTQSIEYGDIDDVYVTVTDENGCVGEGMISQDMYEVNEVEIAGSPSFCIGGGTTLDAGLWITYEWEGPVWGVGQYLDANIEGEYTVFVTDYNGCTSSSSVYVEQGNQLYPNITGNFEFCTGQSAILNAGVFDSYEWSGPETGNEQIFEVTTPGTYTLLVSEGSCTGELEFEVEEIITPEAEITGVTSICSGEATVLSIASFPTIEWSTGASSESISVNQPGIYSVTVTSANGCTSENSVEVTSTENPNIQISGDAFFCTGGSTSLLVEEFDSYSWSTGETTQSIVVSSPGTISVTVTDSGGCTGVGSLLVSELNEDPLVISGSTTFCIGSFTVIDAGTGYTDYQWSNGETSQTLMVEEPGTYSVTVSTTGGCILSEAVTLTEESSLTFNIIGDPNICEGASTILDAGTFESYVWSTPDGPFNTQTIEATTPGQYSVMVDDGNGCTGEGSIELFLVETIEPTIEGVTTLCEGAETNIGVNDIYSTYSWSNGSTESNINVSTPGIYTLTVTTTEGCELNTQAIIDTEESPVPVILGETTFCPGSFVTLDAGEFESYEWSIPGATDQTLEIGIAGEVFVTVTNADGCQGSASVLLTNNEVETPQITGSTAFCTNSSTSIELLGDWSDILWSTGENTNTIDVNSEGTYTVTVTDMDGCTSMNSVNIIEDNNLTVNIVTDSDIICDGSTSTLQAGNFFDTYEWSTGENSSSISVTEEGTYSVTVSDAGGCTGIGTIDINDGSFELPVENDPIAICGEEEVQLGFDNNYSNYAWSTGSDTQYISISSPGIYLLTVTNSLGCEATSEFTVIENTIDPVQIEGDLLICESSTSILSVNEYESYAWNIPGESNNSIEINNAGTYTVTVTNTAGCQAVGSVTITNHPTTNLNIAGSTSFCVGTSTTLSVDESWTDVVWSNGEEGNSAVFTQAGTISVSANDINGCSQTAETIINEDSELNPIIIGNPIICEAETTTLDAGVGYGIYEWSTGESTQTIEVNEPGIYTINVFDLSGVCSGEGSFEIFASSIEEPIIDGPTTACPSENIILSVDDIYAEYEWSTGSQEANTTVTGGGTYTLTVFNEEGCSTTATIEIENEIAPEYAIDDVSCSEDGEQYSVIISTDALTVSNDLGLNNEELAPGLYQISGIPDMQLINITIGNGITSCSENIEVLPPNCECQAIADAGIDQALDCESTMVILSGIESSAGPEFSYEWIDPNGQTISTELTAIATLGGLYTFVVTDNLLECEVTDLVFVDSSSLPEVEISGIDEICEGEQSTLTLNQAFESYAWSTGQATESITVEESGFYEVTVTDEAGCEGIASFEVVLVNLPTIIINDIFCNENADQYSVVFISEAENIDIDPTLTIEDLGNGTYQISDIDIAQSINISASNSELDCSTELMVNPPNCFCDVIADSGAPGELTCNEDSIILGGELTTIGNNVTISWYNQEGDLISNEQYILVTEEGIYTLEVYDIIEDCSDINSVEVTSNMEEPNPEILGMDQICEDDVATLSLDQNYESYNWSTGSTMESIEINETGLFEVTVTNSSGCEGVATFEVEVVDGPIAQLLDKYCNEDADQYTIVIQTDADNIEADIPNPIEDLGNGSYQITGIDINLSVNIEVSYNNLDCNNLLTIDAPNCFCEVIADAGLPGELTCNEESILLGGELTSIGNNITISWYNQQGDLISNEQYISVTEEGIYTLEVYDIIEDCSDINSVEVISNMEEPNPEILGMDKICEDDVTTLSLDQNYDSYSWSTGSTMESIEINETGLFEVTVTNSSGCEGVASFEVEVVDGPTAQLLDKYCSEDADQYTIVIQTDADNIEADIPNPIEDLGNGSYQITGIDINLSVNIEVSYNNLDCNNLLTIDAPNCFCEVIADAGLPGMLTCDTETIIIGGNLTTTGDDIQLSWYNSNGELISNEQFVEVSEAGFYTLEVVDLIEDCSDISAVEILSSAGEPVAVILSSSDNIIDCQLTSVELYVNPEDNTTYVWTTVEEEMNGTSINVEYDGEIILTAIDTITGCSSLDTFMIQDMSEYPAIFVEDPLPLDCNTTEVLLGSSTQDIGNELMIQWYNENNELLSTNNDSLLTSEPGWYYIQATDIDNGCINIDSVEVIEYSFDPEIDAGDDLFIPCDQSGVTLEAINSSSDTDRDFEFEWSTEIGNIVNGVNELNPMVNQEGIYYVLMTDVLSGCTTMDSVYIDSDDNSPYGILTTVEDPFCSNENSGSIEVNNILGGNGPYNFSINGTETNQDGYFDNLQSGNYELLIEDMNGCVHDTIIEVSFENEVSIYADPPVIELIENGSEPVELITNLAEPEIESLEWNQTEGVSCTDCLNPIISSNSNTEYQITVFDEFGCSDTTTIRVIVELDALVTAPNIITPNQEGELTNQRFTIYGHPNVEIIEELHIFDRWGELMFVNTDFQPNRPSLGWNGKFKGKYVVPGVYVYIATYRTVWGETGIIKGDVTVSL